MANQVRIEQKTGAFAVVLEHDGIIQEMDVRDTFKEAVNYAIYLSRSLQLEVYFEGEKNNR